MELDKCLHFCADTKDEQGFANDQTIIFCHPSLNNQQDPIPEKVENELVFVVT